MLGINLLQNKSFLVNPQNIILPPIHIKFLYHINYENVIAMNKTSSGCQHNKCVVDIEITIL